MTAKEKLKFEVCLARTMSRIIHKHEFKYKDVAIMLLGITYANISMFVREEVPGCKKNIKKCRRVTNQIIAEYLDYRLNPDPESPYAYKDDEDGESDVQE